jgi:phosphohistidine phosphatase
MIADAQLYLLRHGIAADKSDTNTYEQDYVRPLTRKGVRQSINAGKVLRAIAPKLDSCYTSPRVRCVQSAVLACAELKGVEPQRDKALLEPSNEEVVHLVKDGKATLIVGHGPELNDAVQHLTGRVVDMSRGTIAGIQITNGQGKLEQLLTPKDVAGMV